MKIIFTDYSPADYVNGIQNNEFEIQGISYNKDEKYPMDITISATEEVLIEIAKFSAIGWNICPIEEHLWHSYAAKAMAQGATHDALYARLRPFKVEH